MFRFRNAAGRRRAREDGSTPGTASSSRAGAVPPGDGARPLPSPGSHGPLADVEAAIAAGASGRRGIADRTGLTPSTVDAALDHLERTGRLRRERLASSCPAGGCSGCGHAAGDACGGIPGRGPVALTLLRRPPARG